MYLVSQFVHYMLFAWNNEPSESTKLSAGVGRSGALIAVDYYIQQLQYRKIPTIDVYGIVYQMRLYRRNMVQMEVHTDHLTNLFF